MDTDMHANIIKRLDAQNHSNETVIIRFRPDIWSGASRFGTLVDGLLDQCGGSFISVNGNLTESGHSRL